MNHVLTNLLLTILKNTQEKVFDVEEIKKSTKITSDIFEDILDRLKFEDLLPDKKKKLTVQQRLGIAIMAIKAGADLQQVSKNLGWLEFEEFAAHIFEENGFKVLRRFRFQAEGRRWEIDVLAFRYPHIICAECKHYTRGIGNSLARGIIETHLEKTEVFSKHLEVLSKKIGVHRWKEAVISPMTLTLSPTKMKVYRRVPSVSVFSLPDYLNEFQGQLERIAFFKVKIPEWKPKPKQLKLG
jgi:hypothetical protein